MVATLGITCGNRNSTCLGTDHRNRDRAGSRRFSFGHLVLVSTQEIGVYLVHAAAAAMSSMFVPLTPAGAQLKPKVRTMKSGNGTMRILPFVWVIWVLATGTISAAQADITVTLAQDGKAAATIVISKEPTRVAQFAAYELQWHLNQITGGEFRIVNEDEPLPGLAILVGDSRPARAVGIDPSQFQTQEYLIRLTPKALVLAGRDKDDRGIVQDDHTPNQQALDTWPGRQRRSSWSSNLSRSQTCRAGFSLRTTSVPVAGATCPGWPCTATVWHSRKASESHVIAGCSGPNRCYNTPSSNEPDFGLEWRRSANDYGRGTVC